MKKGNNSKRVDLSKTREELRKVFREKIQKGEISVLLDDVLSGVILSSKKMDSEISK